MSRSSKTKGGRVWLQLLTGLCLFICSSLIFAGFLLKRGVQFDGLNIGGTAVSGISLHWQEKLDLQIDKISFNGGRKGGLPKDFSLVDKVVRASVWGSKLFSRIIAHEIVIGDMTASIHLDQESSYFTLVSEDLEIRSDMDIDGDIFLIDIIEATSKRFNSHLSGQIRINGKSEQADASLSAALAGVLPITFEVTADPQQVSFHGKETGKITDITPFVDLFGLDHSIQRWITDHLRGSRFTLKAFSGSFPWKEPSVLMESFSAEVRVDDCEYTFAPGLEAIKTEYTDVVFSKGVLAITPHSSTFYGQDGEKSWLDINFNDPSNIILTAYILTTAVANQDILNLLKYYDIMLPFRQIQGKTATDLTLAINLNSEQLTSHGTFSINKGIVEYDQKNYDVKDAKIILENTHVTLDKIDVTFGKMFRADIRGDFDAAKQEGDLDIQLQQFAVKIKESNLILDQAAAKPLLHYQIGPEGATVTASASTWKLGVLPLQLGAFTIPFSFKDISGVLPPTSLSSPPGVKSKIFGSFSLKKQQLDLQCNLLKYHVKDLVLDKSHGPFSIRFDKQLTIKSKHVSEWALNSVPITLYPSEFTFVNNIFSVVNGRMNYGNFFDSNISGRFDHFSKKGEFLLEDLHVTNELSGTLLNPSDAVSVEVDGNRDNLSITVPQFAMEIAAGEDKSWSVSLTDLAAISRYCPVMQKYQLDAGQVKVESKNGGEVYHFSAEIPYGYHFLVKDSTVMEQYSIQGTVGREGIFATINDDIDVSYGTELLITSQNISFNVLEIIRFLKNSPKSDTVQEKENRFSCKLSAYNSGLYFTPDRQAIADSIDFEYAHNKTRIQLEHWPGTITIDIEGKEFSLKGDHLDDVFMDALIPGSDFYTGTMSMAAKGSFNEFSALFKIEDTIVRDFVTLNNVLALVNTIPALITFSLPSYSTEGLPVDSMVAGMKVRDGVATFDALELESPEISIKGAGSIDFLQKKIEMDLNLITQAKKNITKIPLVGYILAGKEKRPSITVKVSGDLFNPDVERSIFQEVATQPFAMVYRTLALPGHLVSHMFGTENDEQKGGSTSDGASPLESIPEDEYAN